MRRNSFISQSFFVAIGVFVFLLDPAMAQGPVAFQRGAVNGASFRPQDFPGGQMAPGSIVSIFGEHMGPAAPILASDFPLPTQLGPLQTRIRLNDSEDCPLFMVSAGQINFQLPNDVAGDQVRLRVITSEGQSNEITLPVGAMGMGLFTRNANGRGMLAASNISSNGQFQIHGPEATVRPGQVLAIWGTGLGETNPPVAAGQPSPSQAPAVNQPQVFIGGQQAEVQYAGRAPGYAGLDQIQVVVPPDTPEGCSVPVRMQLGTHASNIGTIAVSQSGQPCVDALEEIVAGSSHGSIVLSSGLGRLGPGQLGPGAMLGGPLNGSMGGGPGGVRSGPGGVGPGGIGPVGIHPGIPPFSGGLGMGMGGSLGPDVVTARFVRLAGSANADIGVPPVATNSCNSYVLPPYGNADLFAGFIQLLNAGTLTLTGPSTELTLVPESVGIGTLYVAALPAPLTMGTYTVSGSGGPDVGEFGPVDLAVPPLVTVTTILDPGTVFSRQAPLTLDWVGGGSNDIVVIHGRVFVSEEGEIPPVADPMSHRSEAFLCSTSASAGELTVPADIIANLPEGTLVLHVTQLPSASDIARFSATGLDDGGVFRWLISTVFLGLVLGP